MKTRPKNLLERSPLDILIILTCLSILFVALHQGASTALQTGAITWILDLTQPLGDPLFGVTGGHQFGAQMASFLALVPLVQGPVARRFQGVAREPMTRSPVSTDERMAASTPENQGPMLDETVTDLNCLRRRRTFGGQRVRPVTTRRLRRTEVCNGFDEEAWFAEGELISQGISTRDSWTFWG